MKITIKTLSGETFTLEVEAADTILSIKEKIQQIRNFEIASQKLLRKGALLVDEKTVQEIGIQEGDFLVVMVNVKKQPPTQVPQQAPQQPQSQQPPAQSTQPNQNQVPAQLHGESTLLSGPEFENAINEMVSMGFSKEEAKAAMAAAYNNPERAIDYLLNGLPPAGTTGQQQTTQAGVGLGSAQGTGAQINPEANAVLGNLMQSPQFQQLRTLAQQNPQGFLQMMPQLMQAISQQNPQLYQIIQSNPEAFMAALVGNGGQGGAQVPAGQVQINLTEAEKISIDNMTGFGFNKQDCLEAFLVCDRNEEMAINYLLEKQSNGDLLSQHIHREQNDPQNQPGPGEGDDDAEDDDDIYH